MHELSIVEALIEQVHREMRRSGVEGKVVKLELSIGRLSGVHVDSVRFAFDLLSPETVLAGAEIAVHETKPTCRCNDCGKLTEVNDIVFHCPQCASEKIVIEGGRELLLQTINVDEEKKV
jgi:hydrogenase nickel incorporation protein HypA/HybF